MRAPYSAEQARFILQRAEPAVPFTIPSHPMLIAMNNVTQTLEFWPIDPKGGRRPTRLAKPPGLASAGGMAANGTHIAIADTNGTNVIVYDLAKHTEKILADPEGYPADVAIDSGGSIYVNTLSFSGQGSYSVLWYRPDAVYPQVLKCRFLSGPAYIAVDNEGDIFLNENAQHFAGVVEIPRGPSGPDPAHCFRLRLKVESLYAGGVAIDPKTDDLVVSDTGDCAGGNGGTMTIYPKPYRRETGTSHVIGGGCPANLRLDATSTIAFFSDAFEGSASYVAQRTYPGGTTLGSYNGGNPGGTTTIPNTLPN
jgi:hypothetical protein